MMKRRIPRRRAGFTLVEALVCILILNLLTLAVVTGTGAATQVYHKAVFVSESGLLADSVDTALSDVLRYATDPTVDNGTVRFDNANYSVSGGTILCSSDGRLELEQTQGGTPVLLLSKGVYAGKKLTDFTLTYEDGAYSGSYTISSGSAGAQQTETFRFQAVNAG